MTTTYTTGPGQLIIGAVGSEHEFAAQITSCTVEWEVEDGEIVPVLSGGQVSEEDTYTAKLSGNLFGDISDTGITSWSWENKGREEPFTFVPNSAAERAVSGVIKVRPLAVGGDVKAKNRVDFEWPCVGEPALGDYEPDATPEV